MKPGVSFDPVFSFLQVLALCVGAVAVSVWLYLRGKSQGPLQVFLTVVRSLVVASIVLLLLNPIRVQSQAGKSGKAPLLILVDTSHSMSVPDVAGKPRFEAVKEKILENTELQSRLSSGYAPVWYAFDSELNRKDLAAFAAGGHAEGNRTNVGSAMARSLATVGTGSGGGMLIVSDGRDNGDVTPIAVARQALASRIPVFTVCLGNKTKAKDLAVSVKRPEVFAGPAQEVTVGADLVSSGYSKKLATVELRKGTSVVARKVFALSEDGHTDVTFPVKESARGTYRYSMSVVPFEGEVTLSNNRASVLVTVANTTTRVLVLEGQPSWDAKFLLQALNSDPGISTDAIFKLTNDRYFNVRGGAVEQEPASKDVKVPTTKQEFGKYDVVIIGKGYEEFFDQKSAEELKSYISDFGGHLILLRGNPEERSSTLSALEPVTFTEDEIRDFKMELTSEGVENPAFGFQGSTDPKVVVQKLPTLVSATQVAQEKALTVVLARASGVANSEQPNKEMALLAYQNYGSGLVVSLVGEGLWRWSLLPPQLEDYAHCYNDFWTQLVRWLVSQSDFLPGQSLSLKTDHSAYSPGEEVNFMVFSKSKSSQSVGSVSVTGPDGAPLTVALSKAGGKQADFIGSFKPTKPGDYFATMAVPGSAGGSTTTLFSVFERRQEDIDTSSDPGLMRQIALAGGGEPISLDHIHEFPEKLRQAEKSLLKKSEPQSLWDQWPVLATILALLTVEWFVRRRAGMV